MKVTVGRPIENTRNRPTRQAQNFWTASPVRRLPACEFHLSWRMLELYRKFSRTCQTLHENFQGFIFVPHTALPVDACSTVWTLHFPLRGLVRCIFSHVLILPLPHRYFRNLYCEFPCYIPLINPNTRCAYWCRYKFLLMYPTLSFEHGKTHSFRNDVLFRITEPEESPQVQ
jgi:hypothetical protein